MSQINNIFRGIWENILGGTFVSINGIKVEDKSKNNEDEFKEILNGMSEQLQRARIGEYVDLMQSPGRMILLNLLGGIARGFGIAIGFTILGALVVYLLQRLVILNIPVIGGIITEIVKLVKLNIR